MNKSRPARVMWLLNHTSARKFEIPMLKSIGINEIFLPKSFPMDPDFRSASIDWSEDQFLTIPKEDLDELNAVDWYTGGTRNAWEIASRHFDACFFIVLYDTAILKLASKHFKGALLLRAYGLSSPVTYSSLLDFKTQGLGLIWAKRAGRRFYFAKAYEHLDQVESSTLQKRSLYLPLGLHDVSVTDQWQGKDKRIFFVCPGVGFNPYYQAIYSRFISDFSGLPYAIAGEQPVQVNDPAVLGYAPLAVHEENMRQMRLMFYHSTEPNHIHYHPFEAIRAGMPLVFMAGGMLDRLGGAGLPGRCETVREARVKIERMLNDDWKLIERIRQTQAVLLDPMKAENCAQAWRDGFQRLFTELATTRTEQAQRPLKRKRIAVIVPAIYRGGSLCGAKLLAQAIYQGSRQFNEAAEVVFLHLDEEAAYPDEALADLFPGVSRRAFKWKKMRRGEARRAMRYAGHATWEPQVGQYLVAEDGMNQLLDCDLWLVISDRLSAPLLPLRPCVHMVYDYLQRYVPLVAHDSEQLFLDVARQAEQVLVTSDFTRNDAMQYAGLPAHKVVKLPMLAPMFSDQSEYCSPAKPGYFVWTTNLAQHKNHANAFKALRWYYEKLGGVLDCLVTGVNTHHFFKDPLPHLAEATAMIKGSALLRKRVHWKGELAANDYQRTLARAAFLWHAGKIDNGTFSVIEAASLGVPALSSDYPAMREIDQQFALNLAWMNADEPKAMAEQLKQMESTHPARRGLLPSKSQLAEHGTDRLAGEYWNAIRECL